MSIVFSPRHFRHIGEVDITSNQIKGCWLFNRSGVSKLEKESGFQESYVAFKSSPVQEHMKHCNAINSSGSKNKPMKVKMSLASAKFYDAKFRNKDLPPGILSYVTWFLLYISYNLKLIDIK